MGRTISLRGTAVLLFIISTVAACGGNHGADSTTVATSTTESSLGIDSTETPHPDAHFFSDPNAPAVATDGTFQPDVQRVLDITTLQGALYAYYRTHAAYPDVLAALFPDFAPLGSGNQPFTAPPTDPESGEPYTYEPSSDGQSYRISAVMSNGERYESGSPAAP